jgi:glutamine cyclotransferase
MGDRLLSRRWLSLCLMCFAGALLTAPLELRAGDAPVSTVQVLARYPHDPEAFTQGLVIVDGTLYESTGGYGTSSLRRVDLETGRVLQQVDLPSRWFGEGLTDWRDELVMLTWRAGVGLRYQRSTLQPTGRFAISGEGWGLTQDGRHWIMSDGSDELRVLDPADGRELRRLQVTDDGKPVTRLNELELLRGEIWANIWYRDELVRIDPATGRVLGRIDLSGLWPAGQRRRSAQVLNGIAYDRETDQVFVTGKLWPWLYQVEVAD